MSGEFEPQTKAKSKKGKREPTSLHVDPVLWQEVRVMSVLRNKSVTQYFEEALREKLDIDSRDVKFPVGHGGMYIPPPPSSSRMTENQEQPQGVKIGLKRGEHVLSLEIPGLKFPISKTDLIEHIKRFDDESISLPFARSIPDKTFRDKLELEAHFQKYLRDHKKSWTVRGEGGAYTNEVVVGCVIDTEVKTKTKEKEKEKASTTR